jgi:5-methylcytosine-specific restriction endonuclease McrA
VERARTRGEAKSKGLALFQTGIPCQRGHVAERRVDNGDCVLCALARAEKRYAEKRSDVLAYAKYRYAADPKRHIEAVAKRRAADPEAAKAAKRRDYERHSVAYKARSAKWMGANPQRVRENAREWRRRNPDAVAARLAFVRAALAARSPKWLTKAHKKAIRAVYTEANRITRATGIPHQVDHIVPLKSPFVSGLHVPWNLQVLTARENRLKSNSFEADSR